MMASSLGRLTLTSLGFGKDLTQSADYRFVRDQVIKAITLDVRSIIMSSPGCPLWSMSVKGSWSRWEVETHHQTLKEHFDNDADNLC